MVLWDGLCGPCTASVLVELVTDFSLTIEGGTKRSN